MAPRRRSFDSASLQDENPVFGNRVLTSANVAVQTQPEGLDQFQRLVASESSYDPPRRTPIFSKLKADDQRITSIPEVDIRSELSLINRIFEDHRNYYSLNNLGLLATGFTGGAILANTSLDSAIYVHTNHSVRDAPSDEWSEFFHGPKDLGNGAYTLPVFAAAWGVGALFDDTTVGSVTGAWGERSLRAFLVGAPPVILMQKVTGSGRPEEGVLPGVSWTITMA